MYKLIDEIFQVKKSDNTFKNGLIVVIHWPSYQTVHIYVVIHFYDRLVFSNGSKYVQIFYIYIVIGYPIIKKGGLRSHWSV
jgi:hypothetical protein